MLTKICSKCGEEKPATTEYFSKAKGNKDGLGGQCKDCRKEYNKQHYKENQGHYKQYYKENKEERKEYQKQYYRKLRKDGRDVSEDQIVEYIKYTLWFIFGSGIIVEITPLKIKPISSFLGWLGKKLNSEVRKDISQVQEKVDDMQGDLQQHIIEGQRRDILNFANELMRGECKTKEHFDSIIKLHDTYDAYLKKKNKHNGQVSLAYEYISKRYRECLHDNSFL